MLGLIGAYLLGRSSAEREHDMDHRTADNLPSEQQTAAWRIIVPLLVVLALVVLVFA